MVTVRRAEKRPWEFRPAFDVALLRPSRADVLWLGLPALEPEVWPAAVLEAGAAEAVVEAAMGAARADARDVEARGGVSLGVRAMEVEVGKRRLPVIEHCFTHPLRPGLRCVRRDEPLAESGLPTGGLSAHAVFLDEDLACGFLPDGSRSSDGVLVV